jgi:rhodanese-related sulfurtransferase
MSKTVIALFENAGRAQRAIEALKASGFVNERIQVQSGEEFVQRGNLPPHEQPHQGLYRGIKSFFEEIGLRSPSQPQESELHPISRDDAVIVLETSDERADAAADILDNQGAVNVEERIERKAEPDVPHLAGGLEAKTSGRIPPDMEKQHDRGDIDERSLAEGSTRTRRGARVYGPSNEPYGDDWAPKGPRSH